MESSQGVTEFTPMIATIACIIAGIVVLYFLWNRLVTSSRQAVVLICGPPGCGKTRLFSELIYGKDLKCVTSQMPNAAKCDLTKVCKKKGEIPASETQIIDIPGSRQLLARYLPEYSASASAIVFPLKMSTPTTATYLSAAADSLLQMVEASLLGPKRKNSNIRLLFLIHAEADENSILGSTIQNIQTQLQQELDRLTRTGSSGAIPLGGQNASGPVQAISLGGLTKKVDWLVARCPIDAEKYHNAQDVADWLLGM